MDLVDLIHIFLILLSLGIFIYIYLFHHHKWQLIWNRHLLSHFTPEDIFLADPSKESNMKIITADGFRYMKKVKVIIAGMLRDAESSISDTQALPSIIDKVSHLGNQFLDYHVLMVENDSKDNTRKKLLEWAASNPRVEILGCGVNATTCHLALPKTVGHQHAWDRIQKMVYLRNLYLKRAKELYYKGYEYLIVWDLDIIGSVYTDGIANTFGYMEKNPSWAVVCANGIYKLLEMNIFYDPYAFLSQGEKPTDSLSRDISKRVWDNNVMRGVEPIQVDSCFSGFAVYNLSHLIDKDIYYDMTPKDQANEPECEHTRLHYRVKGKKFVNPSMIYLLLLNP